MKIELVFEDVSEDIEGAIADIRVEDQTEADAPAPQLDSKQIGPFTIHHSQPTVNLDLDLIKAIENRELALIVRVKSQTQKNQPIQFLNTTTTLLPKDSSGSVRVMLSRIM